MTPLRFSPARRRPPRENIVPMINVVFLLLIFFLMTAQITPPVPFDVTLPGSTGDGAPERDVLHLSAGGALHFNGADGDAALAAVNPGPLSIRADRAMQAAELARLLPRLAARGVTEISLLTEPVR
jgi:biopolymer transport protein ExbD